MDLSSLLASAAAQAQSILAPIADPDGDGEFTLGGTTYDGVLHLRDAEMVPGPNGLERIERLEIVATAAQFATAPSAAPRAAVSALARNWWCVAVRPAGPNYLLTCIPR